jgi:hypothetical protein
MNFKKYLLLSFGLLLLAQSCSEEPALFVNQNNTPGQFEDRLSPTPKTEGITAITDPQTVAAFLSTGMFGNEIVLQNNSPQIAELSFSPASTLELNGNVSFRYLVGSQIIQWNGRYQVGPTGKISVDLHKNTNPPLPEFRFVLRCNGGISDYKSLGFIEYEGKPAEISSLSNIFDYFFTYNRREIKFALLNTPFKMGMYSRPDKSEYRFNVISFTENGKVNWWDVDGKFTGIYLIDEPTITVVINSQPVNRTFRLRFMKFRGEITYWQTVSVNGFKNLNIDGGSAWRMTTRPISLNNTLWEPLDGTKGRYIFDSIAPQNGLSGPFTLVPDVTSPGDFESGTYFVDPECPFITRVELQNGCRIFFVRPGGLSDLEIGHTSIFSNEWCNADDNTVMRTYRFKENI